VTSDIQKTLNTPAEKLEDKGPESMTEQLRVALVEFEVRHPHLSGLIERITDGLASMGI
jgi:lipoate-protein ligase A